MLDEEMPDIELLDISSLASAQTSSTKRSRADEGPCITSPKHAVATPAAQQQQHRQRRFLLPCTLRRALKSITPHSSPTPHNPSCNVNDKPSCSFSSERRQPEPTQGVRPTKPLYPDYYAGPGPTHEVTDHLDCLLGDDRTPGRLSYNSGEMDDGRGNGHYGGGGRKRRFNRGMCSLRRFKFDAIEDDGLLTLLPYVTDDDREDRPARRNRYEEPVASRLRREILVIAESVSFLYSDFWRSEHN